MTKRKINEFTCIICTIRILERENAGNAESVMMSVNNFQ